MRTQSIGGALNRSGRAKFQRLKACIAAHPFVKGLSARHLATLALYSSETEFGPGERIFREGEPANRFYLIIEGNVALEARAQNASPVLIQSIGAGDVLGWSWLFEPYVWHFDARAVEPTRAIFFYGTWLRDQCEEDHDFGSQVMKRVAAVLIERLQAERRRLLEASDAEDTTCFQSDDNGRHNS